MIKIFGDNILEIDGYLVEIGAEKFHYGVPIPTYIVYEGGMVNGKKLNSFLFFQRDC